MNVIEKDKKVIRWKGFPDSVAPATEPTEEELNAQQEKIARIAQKRQLLAELEHQKTLYESLVARNMSNPSRTQDQIPMPFIVVHTKQEAVINCEMSPLRTEYFLDFSLPFSIHDDTEILKNMFPAYEGVVLAGEGLNYQATM
eukprot:TRINITY_DN4397_c0_g1_i2.p1 TRINITY_DN4397_c0_g1~~TRINITY_DN4397_c0_g1_i2.p1  ORF type:complete len:143 (-),score=25.65 TRINITY_DN4397_c0_g1_i2:23-451(-)